MVAESPRPRLPRRLGEPARIQLAQHVAAQAACGLAVQAVRAAAAAPVGIEEHALADERPVDAGSDLGDESRDVTAGDVRERRRFSRHALAREDVEVVQRARLHRDDDLARPRDRPWPLTLEREHLGAAVAVDHDRAHGLRERHRSGLVRLSAMLPGADGTVKD